MHAARANLVVALDEDREQRASDHGRQSRFNDAGENVVPLHNRVVSRTEWNVDSPFSFRCWSVGKLIRGRNKFAIYGDHEAQRQRFYITSRRISSPRDIVLAR